MAEINKTEPIYDALQLTVYTVSDKPDRYDRRKPDTRGLMQINAAMELISQGLVENVVIGGINFYSPDDGLRISQVYARALKERLEHRRITGIHVIPEAGYLPKPNLEKGARDAGGEVDFLLAKARERSWDNIVSLSYYQHIPRVVKLYESRGLSLPGIKPRPNKKEVTFLSSNHILSQVHDHFDKRFEASPFRQQEGNSFEQRERIKLAIMSIDRQGKLLSFVANHAPAFIKQRLAG